MLLSQKKRKTKPKQKRKAPVQHTCSCEFNKQITNAYEEAFAARGDDESHFNEYAAALSHNDMFSSMVQCMDDEEVSKECVLIDAVRFGFEAGKRMSEMHNLEYMVGYGKGAKE